MELVEFSGLIRDSGIVGAGGAGFPTYAKIDQRTETIVLNCAECEPLLKLHRQLLEVHAREIMQALDMVADVVGAKEVIIGVKGEYKDTVRALKECIGEFPKMKIKLLDSVYPMGDEVVLIYEATGKVVRPGGLPVESGVAVFNVETMYNLYRAVKENHPVTDKVVSVVGEVEHPVSARVPIGCKIEDVVALAGEITTKDPVFLIGGPMMGFIGNGDMAVTKTTNAILVLPKDHQIIHRKQANASIELKRAASSCCQCETCTALCPRHALGHPIEPHLFMRAAANHDFSNANVFLNTFYCCSCGVCEMYACPQGLSPRSLITEYKTGLRAAGIKAPTDPKVESVKPSREYRKVPEGR
ncbi:MAG: 4Fe-4S dicluster domain-containing protein, partial [Lachnospiraceae bacterium]